MVHNHVPDANRANARRMRRAMTAAEVKLWNAIRGHRLDSLSFRRQVPLAGYIVDFACPKHRLIIEIDGSQHGEAPNLCRDEERTSRIEALGWTVLRFWNDDVLGDVDAVCQHILTVVAQGSRKL